MQTAGTAGNPGERPRATLLGALVGLAVVPFLAIGAVLALPFVFGTRWIRGFREGAFRSRIRASGRGISWQAFRRAMNNLEGTRPAGTCIEERFSPKGPVRFWWTPDDVYRESPYEIIDWFTMRKGGRYAPFVHWCRVRYTAEDTGTALLVETFGVSRKEIYTMWSKCRSERRKAQWVEVAPPEILPWHPDQQERDKAFGE